MKTSFLKFATPDSYHHHALLFEPKAKATLAAIHVHGLGGNFYESDLVFHLAKAYTENGCAFFSFNNRGHDFLADVQCTKDGKNEYPRIGAAYEIFGECVHDIDGAFSYLASLGYDSFILEGHSTGANKVVYYQTNRQHAAVKGIALFSPGDDMTLQSQSVDGRQAEFVQLARDMVERGEERKMMPEGSFFTYPMSAQTFLDYFRAGADQDVFPYGKEEAPALAALKEPVFASFGGVGDYIVDSPEQTLDLLKKKCPNAKSFSGHVIPDCGHGYQGGEPVLANRLIGWMKSIAPYQ